MHEFALITEKGYNALELPNYGTDAECLTNFKLNFPCLLEVENAAREKIFEFLSCIYSKR